MLKRTDFDSYEWRPSINRYLIEMAEVEEKTEGGILLNVGNTLKREQIGCDMGIVRAIGPDVLTDFSETARNDVKEGDVVLIAQHAGKVLPDKNGDRQGRFRIINDIDIVAIGRRKQ